MTLAYAIMPQESDYVIGASHHKLSIARPTGHHKVDNTTTMLHTTEMAYLGLDLSIAGN